ncbi:MAG: hypothetical protein AABX37_01840 [Nanoarchaeota archaeon]
MDITIQEKTENPLLKRWEVRGIVKFEGATPRNTDFAVEIGKQLQSDPALVVMKHIYTKFSLQQAVFHAVVYATMDAKTKTEVMTKHLRKKLSGEKKVEATA